MNRKLHLYLEERNNTLLDAYNVDPSLIKEHFGIEQTVLAGGYGYRQMLELVQNGADAILEAHEPGAPPADGNRIHVLLRESHLYVANTGAPLSQDGLDALLHSHLSPKHGNQIGRFGLGFKSLLRLESRIDVFTRSHGAIRFDPQRCRDELSKRFKVNSAPGLRLAWPLDECAADAACADLKWAETIVRVEVRAPDILEHLRQEICNFPAEFLLFFRVPTALVLDDGDKPARELRSEVDRDHQVLHDGSEASRWRVVTRDCAITDARARADATDIHVRDTVPLAWAIPLESKREEAGRFWAFFPTHTPTHVAGILNAPWKLNSDRNAIIGGEWNLALMVEAARLIAETLPSLSSADDPARPLDAFPRQLDRRDEDAAPLVDALWKVLEGAAVIPDAAGVLRKASELWRHPRDSGELARQWQMLAGPEDKARFVHPACLERQRGSRLNALAERLEAEDGAIGPPGLRKAECGLWFKAVASFDQTTAIRVLQLAETYASDGNSAEWNRVRPSLAIIPSQAGTLMNAGDVVLAPDGVSVPGRGTVASALYHDVEARRILADVLKVQYLDDKVWESVLSEALRVPAYPEDARDTGWRAFWTKLRQAPASVQGAFIARHRDAIRIRRRDGQWVHADEVLLPGALVSVDDTSQNQNVLADSVTHGRDDAALSALRVCEIPDGDFGPVMYKSLVGHSVLHEWLEAGRRTYKDKHKNAARGDCLEPVSLTMPKGFGVLTHLGGGPNAQLTKRYLARIAQYEFSRGVQFGHRTTASYPKIDVPHPLLWLVRRYGTVQIGNDVVRLEAVMARAESALALLPGYDDVKSAPDCLDGALPQMSTTPDDIRALWLALMTCPPTLVHT